MNKEASTVGPILQQRLKDHPNLPALTRHVMRTMASGDEAAAAWRVLGADADMVDKVINRIRSALEQALQEVNRQSVKDESTDLAHIIKLATDLKREIKTALPGDWCKPFDHELKADDLPPVTIEFGWHSLRAGGYGMGYPLSVSDVLDWAIQMAKDHTDSLPVRAVTRRGKRPEVQAFIRHLAWQFGQEFGQDKRGTIGHITNAIFDLTDPLDVSGVEGILKDRPAPFKAPT